MISTLRRDLDAVALFARVARLGTFTAAARALGLPKATLSTRIADLEESLGQQLLERSTRQVRLTDAGRVFLASCERILAELETARHAIEALSAAPSGVLRMSAPMALSRSVLAPLLPRFVTRHPALRLKLDVNNRALDQLGVENELALFIGSPPEHSGAMFSITRFRVRLVASVPYLQAHGQPSTPDELVRHQLLGATDPEGRLEWQLQRGDERVKIEAQPHVSVLDPDTRAALVAAHLGISWLPAFLCQDGIDRGELTVVLPDWEPQWVRLHAFLPTAHSRNVKAKAMIDFLVAQLGSEADRASYRLAT